MVNFVKYQAPRVSVKSVSHLWITRVVILLICAVGVLHFPSHHMDGLSLTGENSKTWAMNFASQHQLFESSIVPVQPLFASTNSVETPVVISNAHQVEAPTVLHQQNKPRQVVEGVYLHTSHNALIAQQVAHGPIPQRSTVDYNSQLAQSYAALAMLKQPKKRKTTFEASGQIGPTVVSNGLNNQAAEVYQEATEYEKITTNVGSSSNAEISNSYNAVFNVGVGLGNRLTLISGVSYAQYQGNQEVVLNNNVQQDITRLVFMPSGPNGENGGIMPITETVNSSFSDTLRANLLRKSVEIPLLLKYTIGGQKLQYFVQSGVNTIVGTQYVGNYASYLVSDPNVNAYQTGVSAVSMIIGGGLQYRMLDKMHLSFAPNYQVPIYRANAGIGAFSRLGLLTGLHYQF